MQMDLKLSQGPAVIPGRDAPDAGDASGQDTHPGGFLDRFHGQSIDYNFKHRIDAFRESDINRPS